MEVDTGLLWRCLRHKHRDFSFQSSRPTCIVAGSAPTNFPRQMRELRQGDDGQEYLHGRLRALLGVGDEELPLEQLTDRLEPLSPFHIVTRDAPQVLLLPDSAAFLGDLRLASLMMWPSPCQDGVGTPEG